MSERRYREVKRAQAENIPATIARILSYLKKHAGKMTIAVVGVVMVSISNVASSYFFSPIIDDYIVPLIGEENPDLTGFAQMLVLIGCLYLLGIISSWVWRKMVSLVSTGVLHDLRTELFEHMQDMEVKFYDTHTNGELMNYYTNDIDSIRPLLSEGLPTALSTILTLGGVVIMMFVLNVRLALISVASLAVMGVITFFLSKASNKYFKGIMAANSNITGYVEEMFQGQKVVKVFNHEEKAMEEFEVYAEDAYHASMMSNSMSGMLMPINGNLAYITFALISVVGAWMCIQGEVTLGVLSSFLLYSRQVAGPINNICQQFNGIMMSIAGAERVFKVLDTPTEVDDGKILLVNALKDEDGSLTETSERTGVFAWKNTDGSLVELKGDIRLNHVTFGYEENKTVLDDISLYAKPGQKIAFVGSTGAGKTTITNLINRFYDVNEGSVTYDGIDIKDIKKSSLRQSLGVVLQDTNLFSGTILDNIRYGKLDATDQECIAAAKLANADSFIKRLPDGYNTMLSANGANLSQGQRQLLNIARAAVANPPVLILDEATSSIDTHTERLIEKGMDQLMAGRTVFVIAHRLSTVRNSNAIIVLEHGKIIERGDHDALLANKGRYYQLYTGKAELD